MNQANVTPRLFDSEVLNSSEKRLRTLLDANYSKFHFFTQFAQKLSEAEHEQRKTEGRAGKKVLPATKTLVAATLGCDRFTELPSLGISVDENLSVTELAHRHAQQAHQLCAIFMEKSSTFGLTPPSDVEELCNEFIRMWQPTTRTYDELVQTLYRAAEAKTAGEFPEWFRRLSPQLEAASGGTVKVSKALVYEALALMKIEDETSPKSAIWSNPAWLVMRENLAIVATALANTSEFSKTCRAANIYQVLWDSGIIYAGIHLARMYHDLMASNRLDPQRAEDVIDTVMKQYEASPSRSAIFTTQESHAELFQTYLTIKVSALRASHDPHRVLQLTKEILAAGTNASRLRFEGFVAFVMSILAPELPELQGQGNEEIFDLRAHISRYPEAEAFCRDSAELALASRRRRSTR